MPSKQYKYFQRAGARFLPHTLLPHRPFPQAVFANLIQYEECHLRKPLHPHFLHILVEVNASNIPNLLVTKRVPRDGWIVKSRLAPYLTSSMDTTTKNGESFYTSPFYFFYCCGSMKLCTDSSWILEPGTLLRFNASSSTTLAGYSCAGMHSSSLYRLAINHPLQADPIYLFRTTACPPVARRCVCLPLNLGMLANQ